MLLANRDRKLIAAIHAYQRHRCRHGPLAVLFCAWAKMRYTFWTLLTGSDIHRDARIAPDLRLPHPNGVVMHRDAQVAAGCLIMQQVTLGQTNEPGAPEVCEGAYIGAGAKVLGPVRVGRNARIGANAVVLQDIPDNATATGIPAAWKLRKDEETPD